MRVEVEQADSKPRILVVEEGVVMVPMGLMQEQIAA
jgi:hypothetical protein